MGCGTSQVKKTERSNSQVTIESQQRTVAAYRRQRIARDMEQIASLRAEAEVEKALMLKRSSLGSVDDRRPSYVMRVLEDLAEVEEGQEEVEERYTDPVILNGTYHNEKLAELEKSKNERNIALHSSVTQQHSVTREKEMEDDLHFKEHAQYDELVEDHPNKDIALPTSVTQENRMTPEEKLDNSILTTHVQNEDESAHALLHSEEPNLDTDAYTLKVEQNSNPVSDVETKREDERERSGSERDSTSDSTTHAQEISVKTDHSLTNHDREEGEKGKEDEMENKLDVVEENSNDKLRESDTEIKQENELESKGLERNGIQKSTNLY